MARVYGSGQGSQLFVLLLGCPPPDPARKMEALMRGADKDPDFKKKFRKEVGFFDVCYDNVGGEFLALVCPFLLFVRP